MQELIERVRDAKKRLEYARGEYEYESDVDDLAVHVLELSLILRDLLETLKRQQEVMK